MESSRNFVVNEDNKEDINGPGGSENIPAPI